MGFTLAGFVMAIAGSLAARVIFSLGLGWISFQGIVAAVNEVRGHIANALGQGGLAIDIMLLAGLGDALGILLAALTVRATMYGYAYLGRMVVT